MPALRAFRVAEDPSIRVVELGLACCAVEVESAVRLGLLIADDDVPASRTVLLVSGTVTEGIASVITAAAAEVDAARVVAVGACASTGGPYWDAPSVINGADALWPVTLYVPGCPPRPEAIVDAVVGRGVQ